MLIQFKADVNQIQYDKFNSTPLHIAAIQEENGQVIELLLENKADFTKLTQNGLNALHLAVNHNKINNVKAILKYSDRIDINALSSPTLFSCTAVYIAAQHGRIEILKMLHEAKADLVKSNDYSKTTPLHVAALENQIESAQFLVQHCQKKLSKDYEGKSAFYFACTEKHWEIAKIIFNSVRPAQLNPEDRRQARKHHKALGISLPLFKPKKKVNPVSVREKKETISNSSVSSLSLFAKPMLQKNETVISHGIKKRKGTQLQRL